jgi:hypothetical protein
MDVVYIVLVLGLSILSWGLVYLCDELKGD